VVGAQMELLAAEVFVEVFCCLHDSQLFSPIDAVVLNLLQGVAEGGHCLFLAFLHL
jgi:hypothetical protein